MKPNNSPSQNTYNNRVAQFEADEKKAKAAEKHAAKAATAIEKKTLPSDIKSMSNAYCVAYNKVLAELPAWKRTEIIGIIKDKDYDNRFYEEFIIQVLQVVGDEPTTAIKLRAKGI